MQVRESDHVRELHQHAIGIDVLQGQHLVRVILQIDLEFLHGLGTAAAIADHTLFVLVFRHIDNGEIALLRLHHCRPPPELGIHNVHIGALLFLFLSHGCCLVEAACYCCSRRFCLGPLSPLVVQANKKRVKTDDRETFVLDAGGWVSIGTKGR